MARVGAIEIELRGRADQLEREFGKARAAGKSLGPAVREGTDGASRALSTLRSDLARTSAQAEATFAQTSRAATQAKVAVAASSHAYADFLKTAANTSGLQQLSTTYRANIAQAQALSAASIAASQAATRLKTGLAGIADAAKVGQLLNLTTAIADVGRATQAQAGLANLTRGIADAARVSDTFRGRLVDISSGVRAQTAAFGPLGQAGVLAFDAIGSASAGVIAGIVGGASAVLLLNKALGDAGRYAQDVHLLAQQSGFAADEFTRLAHGAKIAADITGGDLQTALKIFATKRDEAIRGNAEAIASFQRLNVDFAQPASAAFLQVGEAISQLTDKNEKVAVASDLFGRSGARLVPLFNAGAAGIIEMSAEAERLGIVISDKLTTDIDNLGDSADRVGDSILGVEVAVLKLAERSGAIAALTATFNGLADAIAAARAAGEAGTTDVSNPGASAGGLFGWLSEMEASLAKIKELREEQEQFNALNFEQSGATHQSGVAPLPGQVAGFTFDPADNGPQIPADIDFQRSVDSALARQDKAMADREAAAREAASQSKAATAEANKQLAEQERIKEQIFKLSQDTATLEAATVAGAAKTRLEQAERGVAFEKLTADERERLYDLARQVDATEAARLQKAIALLEAERDHVQLTEKDAGLRDAQVAHLNAEITSLRSNLELLPSAVDDLNQKFEVAASKVKTIGDSLADSLEQGFEDGIKGIASGTGDLGNLLKRSLTSGALDFAFDFIKQQGGLFSGLRSGGGGGGLFNMLFGGGSTRGGITTTGAGNAAVSSSSTGGEIIGIDANGQPVRAGGGTGTGTVLRLVGGGSGGGGGGGGFGLGEASQAVGLIGSLGEGASTLSGGGIALPSFGSLLGVGSSGLTGGGLIGGVTSLLGLSSALASGATLSTVTGGGLSAEAGLLLGNFAELGGTVAGGGTAVVSGTETAGITAGATAGSLITAGVLAGIAAGTVGSLRNLGLQRSTNAADREAGQGRDPISVGLLNLFGFKNPQKVHDLALFQDISLTGGIGTINMAILKALGVSAKPPTATGMIGKALGDVLTALDIPIALGAGGRRPGGPSISPMGPTPGGPLDPHDPYYPQVPLPASYASIDRSGASVLSAAYFGSLYHSGRGENESIASAGPIQGILNNAAALGLSAESAKNQIRKVLAGMGKDFENAVLELQVKFQDFQTFGKGQKLTIEDVKLGIAGLIDAYHDLAPAVDAAALAEHAFDKEGKLNVEALERQIDSAQQLAEGMNFGGSALAAFQPNARPDEYTQQLQRNASTTAQKLLFDQFGAGAGKGFGAFTTNVAAAGEAFRKGDFAAGEEFLKQARIDYAGATDGAKAYLEELKASSPTLKKFVEDLEAQNDALKRTADSAKLGAKGLQSLLTPGADAEAAVKTAGQDIAQILGESIAEELAKGQLFEAAFGPTLDAARQYAKDVASGDSAAAEGWSALLETAAASGMESYRNILSILGPSLGRVGGALGLDGGNAGPVAVGARSSRTVRLPSFDVGTARVPGAHGAPMAAIIHGGEAVIGDTQFKVFDRMARLNEAMLGVLTDINRSIRAADGRPIYLDSVPLSRALDMAQKLGRTGTRYGAPELG